MSNNKSALTFNSPWCTGVVLELEWGAEGWPGGQGDDVLVPTGGWDSGGGTEDTGGAGLGAAWGAGVLGAC